MTYTFEQARECVLSKVAEFWSEPAIEAVPLTEASGRLLAESICADRDYPPEARSVRDGFAVRPNDLPGTLEIIGEVRAGTTFEGTVQRGQAVEIMTGAPMPAGAHSVVMVEHTVVENGRVRIDRSLDPGENVNPRASEAKRGETLLSSRQRISFAISALLASVGRSCVRVYRKPNVAILATGDEILPIDSTPLPHQIRNSNSYSLAAQVMGAGAIPQVLPIAKDEYESTRALIEEGLRSDLLLLSGGVSAGRYDIVERVLADLGAEFYFDRVLIQPGQPLVFGRAQDKFFFGLPGNPASTMVTFEIFARAAVELLGGAKDSLLPISWSRLSRDFKQKTGLRRFLPARLSPDGGEVDPIGWQGSGDIAAVARSNAFLVTEPEREFWEKGELIRVLCHTR
ncbi:MAG: molybdopterin molybdotransferase MoeA [Acidobacteriaceae bacterium]|nr:molybdopterin molybdotransferase MoeA [Acidobacteriaceae bacterium]